MADNGELLQWAIERWNEEVRDRPKQNIYRKTLDNTWKQIIRKLGADPDKVLVREN